MSVHRFISTGPPQNTLRLLTELGLTVSPLSGGYEVDITLVDDALLPDLNVALAQMGFTFVSTAPADPRATSAGAILDVTQSTPPPLSAAGEARMYFDSVSKDLMLSEDGGPFFPIASGGAANVVTGAYSCPAGVAVRDAVYLSGADNVDQADSDDAGKQPLIGVVLSKPSAVTCIVAYYGEVSGFIGLTPGATYYLGTAPGTITTVAPSTPGNIVQRMGFARNATTLMVMTDRDWTEIT